ncbi:hypothetical protein BASA50_004340 [Batrachochytrium salamandrivorans]|uniref:Transmembrane protein n=1 Tax=Batrachochytrium salamandrivorans TaxID=1357716 RepID=A0ABQ8FG37_9FUNG|nr:hypothetical protein BASA50_004340 [Batrachochytrium salamandrivorans]
MKFHAFSLIAMFMVTANALTIPMDSMDDASGLVKRQDSGPTFTPTNGPKLRLLLTLSLTLLLLLLLPMGLNFALLLTLSLTLLLLLHIPMSLHMYLSLILLIHLYLVPSFSSKSVPRSIEEEEWTSEQEPLKVIKIQNWTGDVTITLSNKIK